MYLGVHHAVGHYYMLDVTIYCVSMSNNRGRLLKKARQPNKSTNKHTNNDHIFSRHVDGYTAHSAAV